jgi:NAD(P)-dependent dehydrogenase (short-subunit alcohol dehydrogenase family)
MPTVLITGASTGLGLEFASQYGADGWRVIATCRHPESAASLKALPGDILLRPMDITNSGEVNAVAAEFEASPIDVLLNNAAIHGPRTARASFGELDVDIWLEVMRVNAMAPMKVTEAFLRHVTAGDQRKLVFVSSRAGSIAERGFQPYHQPGGTYIYRSSKAALNAAAKSLAFDLAPKGFSVVVLHPGFVKTEMGGAEATIKKEASVAGMREVILRSTPADSFNFRNYDGAVIPW